MVFPDSPRVIFDRNPLRQVICQLRFPPILAIISKEPADFQDRVRTNHPQYEKTLAVSPIPKELTDILGSFPPSPEASVHKFRTVDGKTEISLARDFIGVATTEYKRWEQFEATIRLAATALEQIYTPPFYSRIGLRYINIIDRGDCSLTGVSWGQLIKGSVLGLVAESDLTGKIKIAQSQTIVNLGQPDERVTLRNGLILQEGGAENYGIDADFYCDKNTPPGETFSVLGRFNREAGYLFNWATTEQLRTALVPRPIG